MSLRQSNQSGNDWGWLRDTDSNPSDDISVNGIGVLAVHFHQLIIDKPFVLLKNANEPEITIDTFRLCLSAYALSRYSKTVRVYSMKNHARFDQTMHMLIRIYDNRHDKRHLIHVILYGYLNRAKRYALIADQVIDSIKLVSMRHISEAVVFEGSNEISGKATLLIELIFVYGRHGYNFSSQLIFQSDIHRSDTVQHQTLFERILPTNAGLYHRLTDEVEFRVYFVDNTTNGKLFDPPEIDLPIYLKLSFDELNQHIVDHQPQQRDLTRIVEALATGMKYSSMQTIMDMYSSRKQRLEILFDFLTEGPYLPEQNIIEPTALRLIPWGITYWKRGLSGIPLHGSTLDMDESHKIETDITHLQNTSPILRQLISHVPLNMIKDLVRRVINFIQSNNIG